MNLANVFNPSKVYFNPMNLEGYINFRIQEAVNTIGTEHTKKIDVPEFLNDWIRLCSTYHSNLVNNGLKWTLVGIQRGRTNDLIRQRCKDDCRGIQEELMGIQNTVKLYQQQLDADISAAAQTQVYKLYDLQKRYMEILERLK